MKLLEERILSEGTFLPGGIVKVDAFLNHQLDPMLLNELAKEFANHFKNKNVTKILTVESSGIAIAILVGLQLNVPVVFAKKTVSKNLGNDDLLTTTVHSFTKDIDYVLTVNKNYISKNDNVLLIDDFLACGEALKGMISVVNQVGAKLAGAGVAIEKDFQPGGKTIRDMGVDLFSLAVVALNDNGDIVFKAYQ